MESVYAEITVIICLAAALAIFFRFLKQPAVLAYILTGILVGPVGLFHVTSGEVLHSLGQIGITLLLFMLGLELRLKELRSVGRVAITTGVSQILITSSIGFLICLALGFSPIAATYLGIAVTFSSTIIIVKLLSDKKDINSLYGKIAVGILLVQDFVAVIALIILSGFNSGSTSISIGSFVFIILKAVALFGWTIFISQFLLPTLVKKIARSSEVLFLFSIAWAFGLSAVVSSPFIGFSIEIGGFLAGLALANSSQNFQIVAKVKSLRDFFITIFFVSLGMSLVFEDLITILVPALILSFFILIGNPIILTAILGFLGYRKRVSFLVGLTVAQISEFSMIVIFMGNKIGHVPDEAVSLITLAGTITFVLSTYMILNGNVLYQFFSPILSFFERKNVKEQRMPKHDFTNHILIIGGHQMGQSLIDSLEKEEGSVVVLDFDPDIVAKLEENGVPVVFGDIADPDIQERVNLDKAKLVISTVPDIEDNLLLLEGLKAGNKKAKVIVAALENEDASTLYEAGADYVVLPHLAGGRFLAKLLKDNNLETVDWHKARDLVYIT